MPYITCTAKPEVPGKYKVVTRKIPFAKLIPSEYTYDGKRWYNSKGILVERCQENVLRWYIEDTEKAKQLMLQLKKDTLNKKIEKIKLSIKKKNELKLKPRKIRNSSNFINY